MSDSETIRSVFALLDPELWLVTSKSGSRRAGLVATLVGQASIVPDHPRVVIGLSPQHYTTTVIRRSRGFVLHLLDDSHRDLAWSFGTRSGHDGDKFTEGAWVESSQGHPRLETAAAWLECDVEQSVESGDRVYFLARVVHGDKADPRPLLTIRSFMADLTPTQCRELQARLTRDAAIDAELIRQFQRSSSPYAGLPLRFNVEPPAGDHL